MTAMRSLALAGLGLTLALSPVSAARIEPRGEVTKRDVRRYCSAQKSACLEVRSEEITRPYRTRSATLPFVGIGSGGEMTVTVENGPRIIVSLKMTDGDEFFCAASIDFVQNGTRYNSVAYFNVDKPYPCDVVVAGQTRDLVATFPPPLFDVNEPFTVAWRSQQFDVP
jgi:hypothetical protein